MATAIADINIRQVLSYIASGKKRGWNPSSGTDSDPDYGHSMSVVTWRDTGDKPTDAEITAEWDAHSERYELATITAEPDGENHTIIVTLKHNIDDVSEVTLTVNGASLSEATALTDNVGTETMSISTTTTIGIEENYPYEEITIEV